MEGLGLHLKSAPNRSPPPPPTAAHPGLDFSPAPPSTVWKLEPGRYCLLPLLSVPGAGRLTSDPPASCALLVETACCLLFPLAALPQA